MNKERDAATYGVALKEKSPDDGLDIVDAIGLFARLNDKQGIPIEIEADNSIAMGFVSMTEAEAMDYDFSGLKELLVPVMNDMEKEDPTCCYVRELPATCSRKWGLLV
jgi:hypothetical protein